MKEVLSVSVISVVKFVIEVGGWEALESSDSEMTERA